MLQIQTLREQKDLVLAGLKKKNFARLEIVDEVLAIDEKRRQTQFELDNNLS